MQTWSQDLLLVLLLLMRPPHLDTQVGRPLHQPTSGKTCLCFFIIHLTAGHQSARGHDIVTMAECHRTRGGSESMPKPYKLHDGNILYREFKVVEGACVSLSLVQSDCTCSSSSCSPPASPVGGFSQGSAMFEVKSLPAPTTFRNSLADQPVRLETSRSEVLWIFQESEDYRITRRQR